MDNNIPIFWRAEWRGPHNIPHCHVIEAHAENLAISRAETYAVRHGHRINHGTLTVTPYDNSPTTSATPAGGE